MAPQTYEGPKHPFTYVKTTMRSTEKMLTGEMFCGVCLNIYDTGKHYRQKESTSITYMVKQ
jgi:hypothetical protein